MLAKRIRECRYAKGWGPDDLAIRANISRTALYQIESGRTRRPRALTLRQIALALGIDIDYLLGAADGGAPAPVSGPSSDAGPMPRGGAMPAPPDGADDGDRVELSRKFAVLLRSPLGAGLARLVEDAYGLLLLVGPHRRGDRDARPSGAAGPDGRGPQGDLPPHDAPTYAPGPAS